MSENNSNGKKNFFKIFVAAVGVLALEVMQQGHKDHGCKGPFRCRAHSRRTITSIIKNHAANCNRKINGRRPPEISWVLPQNEQRSLSSFLPVISYSPMSLFISGLWSHYRSVRIPLLPEQTYNDLSLCPLRSRHKVFRCLQLKFHLIFSLSLKCSLLRSESRLPDLLLRSFWRMA